MRYLTCIIMATLLSVPARGDDAAQPVGKIIWSVSTDKNIHSMETFTFFFKQTDGKHTDYLSYWHDRLFYKDRTDFVGDAEKGGVEILTVPAGNWVLRSYAADMVTSYGSISFFPKAEFSVPITVKPGEAVYIGSYRANTVMGKNLFGIPIPVGEYFTTSDQSGRDIAIAKKKDEAIPDVTVAIPDFKSLNIPGLLPPGSASTDVAPRQPS